MATPMPLRLASGLLEKAGFAHAFSTRAVDLALAAPDRAAALARFAAEAGIAAAALREANQVHGATVVDAAGAPAAAPLAEGDALVSRGAYAVGVRVADCVPILVADRTSGAVAAIHAGWKGFVAGVIPAALRALGAGVRPGDLVAAVGPCIGPCCFEVGGDVAQTIEEAAGVPVVARRAPNGDKAYVDLRAGVHAHLVNAGVRADAIDDVGGCTRCDEARFFSFRRGGEGGRMLAVIAPR